MEERKATARWVRRLGSVAALAILVLLLGELPVHESRSETPPPSAAPSAQPHKRYGPNLNARLSPQIDRIIRLAQRNTKEEDKSGATGGGTQLKKSAPVQKKAAPVQKKAPVKKTAPVKKKTAPVQKKKTTPTVKKKVAPVKKKEAPAVRKKETAPVKKKETAPVKKQEPAAKTGPIQSKEPIQYDKGAPAKETAPGAPPSDEQLQENKEFCAQNPDSPKCAPPAETGPTQEELDKQFCAKNPTSPKCAGAKEQPPATEKICTANPKYPGCDKLGQPDLGAPDGEAGGVGSICEQNPQLPQCQGEPPAEEDAVEAPPGPPGEDAAPGFPPPGGPIPPGPPPSPPSGEGEAPPPPGPTIQTVTECPEGQAEFAGRCVPTFNCPEGQAYYPSTEQCVDYCGAGQVVRLGVCVERDICQSLDGLVDGDQCVESCPEGSSVYLGQCVAECPVGTGIRDDGTCGACPAGTAEDPAVGPDGRCLEACPAGTISEGDQCVAGCPEGQRLSITGECFEPCPEGTSWYAGPGANRNTCVAECPGSDGSYPQGYVDDGTGQCRQCAGGTVTGGQCACTEEEGFVESTDPNSYSVCVPCNTNNIYDGKCLDPCPNGTHREGDQCVAGCAEGEQLYAGYCVEAEACPDGELLRRENGPGYECVSTEDCLDDELMVIFEDENSCVGWTGCRNLDRVIVDRICLEQCPEGTLAYNNTCFSQCPGGVYDLGDGTCGNCPAGQEGVNGLCVAACPEGTHRTGAGLCSPDECPDGQYRNTDGSCVAECPEGTTANPGLGTDPHCSPQCPEGQLVEFTRCVDECGQGYDVVHEGQCLGSCPQGLLEHEGQCLESCPEGQAVVNQQCVPETEAPCLSPTELRVDGVCMSLGELQYDDVMQYCLALDEAGVVVPEDVQGATPQETCENVIADACEQGQLGGVPASEAPACTERACGEGQENVAGQCQCPSGQYTLEDGSCSASCPDGMYLNQGSQCVSQCPGGGGGVLNGQCFTGSCPEGYTRQGNECVANCPPGQTQGADGACSNPCAAGDVYYNSECRPQCPAGQAYSPSGTCTATCPGSYLWPVNGICTSPIEVPFEDAVEQCMAGAFHPGDVAVTGRAECEAAIAAECAARFDLGSVLPVDVPRRCGDIANPGEGTFEPPPPPDETAPPPDDGAPPPDDGAPPPEDQAPPPPDETAPPPDETAPPPEDGAPPPEETAPPPDETAPLPEDGEAPPPEDGEAPPEDGEAPPPPDDGAPPPEDQAPPPPDETAPPPDETAPPPDETAPPSDGTLPPPPEDAGEYGSVCEQNPQLPQCQNGEAPPPDETAPPPDETAPPPDETAPPPPPDGAPPPPPSDGAPPPPGKPPAPLPPAEPKPEAAPVLPLAVVIAVDDYDNEKLTGSPQAISNAAHVVRFLKSDLGMDGAGILTGHNATLSDFHDIFGKTGEPKSELLDLLKKTKTQEVIVYYAGRAQALDGGKDVLLLPADADPAKPETGVRLSALYDTLAAMGIPRLRLYLDPSFVKDEDVVTLDAGPSVGLFGLLTPRAWITLSGASNSAAVPRDPDRERSLFVESLVAGLRGIADTTGDGDSDGTVSAGELHGFIAGQAEAAAKRGDQVSVPFLSGSPTEPLRTY